MLNKNNNILNQNKNYNDHIIVTFEGGDMLLPS